MSGAIKVLASASDPVTVTITLAGGRVPNGFTDNTFTTAQSTTNVLISTPTTWWFVSDDKYDVSILWNGVEAATDTRTPVRVNANTGNTVTVSANLNLPFLEAVIQNVDQSASFNVKEYGAKGDGTTDDTTVIQRAVNAASANGGGIVYFPPGTYQISSFIFLKDNVNLLGAGIGSTTLRAASGLTTAVLVGASGDTVSDVTISDLTINGNYTTLTSNTHNGIQVTSGARIIVSRVRVFDVPRAGILFQTGTSDCIITDCRLEQAGQDGNTSGHTVSFTNAVRGVVANSVFISGKAMGVSVNNSPDVRISGNYFTVSSSVTGFEAIGIAAGSERCTVTGNTIVDSQDNGISVSANNCTVTGNSINGALNFGIGVYGLNNTISGNVVKNAGRQADLLYSGILVASGGGYTTVVGNRCYDDQSTKTQNYGIRESGTADYNIFEGNHLSGNLTGPTLYVGANSVHGNNLPATAEQGVITSNTYGTTVTPTASAGDWQTITVTNSTAFTVAAPTNPPSSTQTQRMTIEIFNNSGGAMGTITWNAAFVFAGQTWVNPASTKRRYATFEFNGTSWVCTAVAAADY